jgi:hypothetical protein
MFIKDAFYRMFGFILFRGRWITKGQANRIADKLLIMSTPEAYNTAMGLKKALRKQSKKDKGQGFK